MGLLSWFYGSSSGNNNQTPPTGQPEGSTGAPGMNGAEEVRRPDPPVELTYVEFGYGYKETLSGHCPVSNKIEPCTWRIMPASDPDPAKIRISF